jgi:hypothetical protein
MSLTERIAVLLDLGMAAGCQSPVYRGIANESLASPTTDLSREWHCGPRWP